MADVKHTPKVGDILRDGDGPQSFVIVEKVGPEGLTVRSCHADGRVWWPFSRIIPNDGGAARATEGSAT